eukprot:Nk52_evm13s2256 gene=Nk52_evmTU13s2256
MDFEDLLYNNEYINTKISNPVDARLRKNIKASFKKRAQKEGDPIQKKPEVKNIFEKEIVEKKTIINIDSRYRDYLLHPSASKFKYELGTSFKNVKKIKLVSTEIPNTSQTFKKGKNTRIYFSENDKDIYSTDITPGNYNPISLKQELEFCMNNIKREDGSFFDFEVSIDLQSDVVSFLSLNYTYLQSDPIKAFKNSNLLTIEIPNASSFKQGDNIYIAGISANICGIPSRLINGIRSIKSVVAGGVQIEVSSKAFFNGTTGGNQIKIGTFLPVKFYWSKPSTVGGILGFLPEDTSSEVEVEIDNTIRGVGESRGHIFHASTIKPHSLKSNDTILINFATGFFRVTVVDDKNFHFNFFEQMKKDTPFAFIPVTNKLKIKHPSHGLVNGNELTFYNLEFKGKEKYNHQKFKIEKIDENHYNLLSNKDIYDFITFNGKVRVSSNVHGFQNIVSNTVNDALNRNVNLSGENYLFLCIPNLETVNDQQISDAFAKIQLNAPPGSLIYNSFVPVEKIFFDKLLDELTYLDISFKTYGGELYDFNDNELSLSLEITEMVTVTKRYNSRTGNVQ